MNGLYEFNPMGGMFAHGVSFGYINLTAFRGYRATGYRYHYQFISSVLRPKVMFGSDKIKAFIKGAIGCSLPSLKRKGLVEVSDFDFGLYGEGGAGIMVFLSENIFINAEYEIAWASNSWYKDGWMNTAMGGIGFRF